MTHRFARSFGRKTRLARAKVEQALGHRLDSRHPIHHIDGDDTNDNNCNLVACEDRLYHQLLEIRGKAYRATGDPEKRKCQYCHEWDVVSNLYIHGYHTRHRRCQRAYRAKISN